MSEVLKVRLTGSGWESVAGRRVGEVVEVLDRAYAFEPAGSGGTWVAPVGAKFNYVAKDPKHKYGGVLVEEGSAVEHPDHYNAVEGMPEVWDILDAFFPDNPNLWNAGKYLLRTGRKGDTAEQLNKLKQYVDRELERLNAGKD